MRVLRESGAVLRGPFILSSGRHSDLFVQKFRTIERPRLTRELGARACVSPGLGLRRCGDEVTQEEQARS